MKKTILSIITILAFNFLILTSCGEEKKELTSQNAKPATTNMTSTDKPQEEEKIEPASVVCKIYFKSDDIEEEDGTITKGGVGEIDDFATRKAYTFCYDSEEFQKLKIEGTGKQITIEIKEENKTIYKKENIEIKDALTISSKEVNLQMGRKYTISIKQNEKSLFVGKVDSQGCM
jgi:hypothetical protein